MLIVGACVGGRKDRCPCSLVDLEQGSRPIGFVVVSEPSPDGRCGMWRWPSDLHPCLRFILPCVYLFDTSDSLSCINPPRHSWLVCQSRRGHCRPGYGEFRHEFQAISSNCALTAPIRALGLRMVVAHSCCTRIMTRYMSACQSWRRPDTMAAPPGRRCLWARSRCRWRPSRL